MALRRGFRTEANTTVAAVRNELGLGPLDRLDPRFLADLLDIDVLALSDLVSQAPAAAHLLTEEPDAFSAATIFVGARRAIIHNDAHTRGRARADLAHELAHALLLHPPAPALDHRGNRMWNQDAEDEATWLAGALLITDDAALAVARGWKPVDRAALHFGVSVGMVKYRLNVTGARTRAARTRAARARGPRSRADGPPARAAERGKGMDAFRVRPRGDRRGLDRADTT